MNGYVRITAFRWHKNKLFKYVDHTFEGKVEKGLSNFKGFGRYISSSDNLIAIGYFDGFKKLSGQYLLFSGTGTLLAQG